MRFRPCIDIHNGQVKQIVGGSLRDQGDYAKENFVAVNGAAWFADAYRRDGLNGGHIILLNAKESDYYNKTKEQAIAALNEWKGGLQVGGGITPDTAEEFLDAGASHVIVTSYVFGNGQIRYENLERIRSVTGKERLVLDVSCRKKTEDGDYYVVTDRWQKFTDVKLDEALLLELSGYCDEFLVHAVDVEGIAKGIEGPLASLLGQYSGIPVTYAGGISSMKDLELLSEAGKDRLDFTVGSALDLFGGSLSYREIVSRYGRKER